MHIKQITLSNFRSFKQQPEVHPFSPGTNAVVGRNGSGKSNLFDAVQFVLLAPKFWTLRTEDRQALLHEGSGQAAVNAYVEIVFSNADGRFQGESSDEIVLRRTVGSKKDELFLQRKKTTKNEVMSLLEGAGFSKSNPYFIVQQGKVNALCVMSDGQRLELLKEVAGTTLYDEKKKESQSKMEENNEKIEKIQETLSFMNERLDDLKSEKEELTIYTQLEKQRKALAYTLHDKELRKARETLDETEQEKTEEAERRDEIYERARMTADEIGSVEAVLKSKTAARKRNKVQLKDLTEDHTAAMTVQTQLELKKDEMSETIKSCETTLRKNKDKLSKLKTQIEKEQHTLHQTIEPKYEDAKDTLARMSNERNEAQKKIEGLYAKQGRGKQFDSQSDRDAYLQNQINDLNAIIKNEKESVLQEAQDSLSNIRRSMTKLEGQLSTKKRDVLKKEKLLDTTSEKLLAKRRERNEMADKRKEHWGELSELTVQVSDTRENVRRAQSTFRKVMPKNTAMGLDALNRIIHEERVVVGQQYFGPVMQNIELMDAKFQTAVEAAAQNSLFHVIVDTDATAARLMNRLERDRLGRVTFLPLNQLHVPNVNYPNSPDIVPLLKKCLKYDARLERAMQHVFGKKLLANSAEVASTWSTRCKMDVVTLEGDLCSRKGAMSGGYIDSAKSRLKAFYDLNDAEEILSSLETREKGMKEKNNDVDKQVSTLMRENQKLEADKANLEHALANLDEDIAAQKSRFDSQTKQAKKIEDETIPPIEVEIKSLKDQVNLLEEEMGSELSETLTDEEKSLLQNLKSIQTELDADIESQNQTLEEVSVERQRLLSLLEDNLLKRKQELEEEGATLSSRRRSTDGQPASRIAQEKRKEDLELVEREVEEAKQNAEGVEERLAEAKQLDQDLYEELSEKKKELDALRAKDEQNINDLKEAREREEKLMNKRTLCVQRRELHARKIQELGSLPSTTELAKNRSLSISALMRELEKINKELKKYSHVNKKAFDQFVNFSDQREQLLTRKDEVDRGAEKVTELIESLDRQKDEAINRTFRGVSAHFAEVFKELVPNGKGELIMRTTLDSTEEAPVPDEDDADARRRMQNPSVNRYCGIGIKVRFSNVGENYLMSQLSGGQKSLVALALIFAIQRCDPAPFYLFDELDQALDSSYRKAVAGLIKRQANNQDNPTQFICSTFRPEIVSISNQCYGIGLQNKESNIYNFSKKDALKFIARLMSEEEAVGDVSSLATSNVSRAKKRKSIEVDPEDSDKTDRDEEDNDNEEESEVDKTAKTEGSRKKSRISETNPEESSGDETTDE